ncbi:MAG: dihydrodipicolinate synthase family protein [Sphingomonadaceae bacterium]
MSKEPLPAGVYVALATPLTPDYDIDVEGVHRLVDHVIAGGIYGLNILGSTGELPSLSEPKRRRLVGAVMEANRGRVPVIAALAQNSLDEAAREVEALARQGVKGVLVTPPSYYPTSQPAVESYYRALAERSPVPLLAYNIPQFTKVPVAPQTIVSLARDKVVAGIKDSSRDFEYFSQVVFGTRGIEGFRVFTGSDTMLYASLALGADGTIAGGPNLAPKIAVDLYQAFRASDTQLALARQREVLKLVLATRRGVFPAGIKAGLEILGICSDLTAPPIPRYTHQEKEELAGELRELGLLPSEGRAKAA